MSKFYKVGFAAVAATGFAVMVGISTPSYAEPNEDSAAGQCGGGGLGEAINGVVIPLLKSNAENEGQSLGQSMQADELPRGFSIPDGCAPKAPD